MPRKEGKKAVHISVTESELERVNQAAKQRGFKVTADYLRDLIEKDMAAHGEDFKFEVNRGGYRGATADE